MKILPTNNYQTQKQKVSFEANKISQLAFETLAKDGCAPHTISWRMKGGTRRFLTVSEQEEGKIKQALSISTGATKTYIRGLETNSGDITDEKIHEIWNPVLKAASPYDKFRATVDALGKLNTLFS